jgi:Mn-dependent DtxR family transcriptional regulator
VGGFWQVTDQLRGKRGDLSVAIGDFVIQMGETTTAAVAEHFSISSDKASQYLGRLRRNGIISQVKRGTWAGERVAQS